MKRNAPAFIASLPALARSLDCAPLARSLTRAMLSARLNAFLPSSVWKQDKNASAFYDIAAFYNPNHDPTNGQFAHGGYSLKISSKELKGTAANPRTLYATYLKHGGKPLAHDGLPSVAKVTQRSIEHHNTIKNIKQRNAIISRPKLLQALFRRGYLSKQEIKNEKDGKPDKNKADWLKCWHIRGKIWINADNYAYDFTVFQRKNEKEKDKTEVIVYDFAIRDK